VAEEQNVFRAALRLARALQERGVPYAIGGALAFGIWGEVRATLDIDLNVFVPLDGLAPVLDALAAVGARVDPAVAKEQAREEGMFLASWGPYRVDVFVPSIDFSWEAQRTVREEQVEGHAYAFLSPEALAVFKLLFFRPKDRLDLEKLVFIQGAELDCGYVRARMVEMMGEGDERVREWDRIVADFGAR
jgi:hypothetical protein